MRRVAATLALLALVLAAFPLAATAVAATPRASFSDVEDELMCVTCGVPLPLAESPQADRERQQIRRDIAAGMTKEQIKADLAAIYTDRVLAKPKGSGFGLAVYLVPIIIALAGLALIAILLPRWRRARADEDGQADGTDAVIAPELTDEDAAHLDEDLARYRV